MKIETMAIDALIPYARNSRTHSGEQVAQIAASIREFGFTNPVLIDADGGIIAGHGRVMAARRLSMTEVPCIRLGHLSEAQRRAYVIADNNIALNAGWDDAMLDAEMDYLLLQGFDMHALGIQIQDDVDDMRSSPEITDFSAAPVLDEFWISVRGPLVHQAKALQRLQEVMSELPLDIELGTVTKDA